VAHVRDELAFQYEQLDDAFFQSDFLLLNSILWEPLLEKRLTDILRKAKEGGSINLLGTASDPRYRNTKQWILGEDNTAYPYIDVLMMNLTEAKGYAGTDSFKGMKQFFKSKGVKSFVVTDGRNPTYVYAGDDGPFNPFDGFVPVAEEIDLDKEKGVLPEGDGVGCGDNFDSGILASLAMQKSQGIFPYDLLDAVLLGNVAGGLTSCIRGGTFFEKYPGKKRDICMRYYPKYRKRIRKELGCDKARRDA
jgi:sugar/nucleoside kinase (ribokinase family)